MMTHAVAAEESSPATPYITTSPDSHAFTRSKPYVAFQDALLGMAIAGLALDDRIPFDTLVDIVCRMMSAADDARISEMTASAHSEAAAIPGWRCAGCAEINPGTFEICWHCEEPRPVDSSRLSAQAEVLLGIESAIKLRRERRTVSDRETT